MQVPITSYIIMRPHYVVSIVEMLMAYRLKVFSKMKALITK